MVPQKHSFFRNVSLLVGGTLIAQVVSALAAPVLTRLYSPQDFGTLAVFSSLIAVLVVVGALRYEMAIPMAKTEEEAVHLVVASIGFFALFSLSLTALLLSPLSTYATSLLKSPTLAHYLWLVPIGVLFIGLYQIFYLWNNRQKQFAVLSSTKVLQSVGQGCIQIASGSLLFKEVGLLIGYMVGQFLGVTSLVRRGKVPFRSVSWRAVLDTLKVYKNFPLYNLWASLINVIGLQAPPVLMSLFFSAAVTGHFALTMRLIGLPAALVGQAVGQVFYRSAVEKNDSEEGMGGLVQDLAATLLKISFPLFAVVMLVGPDLFGAVFGASWRTSGVYARYLSPWMMVSFISSPLSTIVLIKGKQKQGFLICLYETSLRLLGLWAGKLAGSAEVGIMAFSASGVVICTVYIVYILRLSGVPFSGWLRGNSRYLCAGLSLAGLTALLVRFLPEQLAILLAVGAMLLLMASSVRSLLRRYAHV
ncbi:lipopolysaccharide biosynthesis protein [Geomonas sp.]|uniref:lipopolysaccharide biosynthesis protein n=1 Tax=Geomonas sp. TaxID=2651584 RepID=UPI002B491D42|nr:lipopolysaccharide biosynthesis protein [Geomonas sp.]HJV36041.1 lipopolysaccharide biosynthesis protein [Geomonas sp.]